MGFLLDIRQVLQRMVKCVPLCRHCVWKIFQKKGFKPHCRCRDWKKYLFSAPWQRLKTTRIATQTPSYSLTSVAIFNSHCSKTFRTQLTSQPLTIMLLRFITKLLPLRPLCPGVHHFTRATIENEEITGRKGLDGRLTEGGSRRIFCSDPSSC